MNNSFTPNQHNIMGTWTHAADHIDKVDELRSPYPKLEQPTQASLLNDYKAAVNEDNSDQADYLRIRGTELYGKDFAAQAKVIDEMFADDTAAAVNRSLATLGESVEPEETAA